MRACLVCRAVVVNCWFIWRLTVGQRPQGDSLALQFGLLLLLLRANRTPGYLPEAIKEGNETCDPFSIFIHDWYVGNAGDEQVQQE